jgi:hypothetical protein
MPYADIVTEEKNAPKLDPEAIAVLGAQRSYPNR